MSGNGTHQTDDQMVLRSRLSDAAQLPAWIEGLASRYGIPGNVRFAIELCLEEAISNIILHGYGGRTDGSVTVRFTMPQQGNFVFVVEDEAPQFNPLDAPELPALNPQDEIRIGGQGIRLLRRFAGAVEYQQTPTGNQLKMCFSADGSAA